ncbi:MAG: hypothetical protein K6B70_03940 [Clostridia bacterium]|nr:hypothetical protein [Clostridia bacterium]
MLTIVQSALGNRQYGVVDTDAKTLIVPLSYSAINFQKYGIVAYTTGGYCDVFSLDGLPILTNAINPLLLDGKFLIVSDSNRKCYIFRHINGQTKPFCRDGYDAITFFIGSKLDPVAYTSGTNYQSIFNTPDYINHGASFDRYICAAKGNGWGIINRNTGKIEHDFTASTIIHRRNAELIVSETNGFVKIYK